MIPLAVPNLCGNEKKYLIDCVDTTFVSSVGPYVTLFEKQIAEVAGAKYCVATASGTSALHLALKTINVGVGDLVITPSYTFVATVNSIIHAGAEPWLFDVEPDTFNLDVKSVEKELRDQTQLIDGKRIHKKTGKRIGAIMPVYFNGRPARMDEFIKLSKEYNIPIVSDGAAAIGAKYKSQALASVADLTTFSFNGNKIITSGGGGAIVTNDEALAKKARHLCTTARVGADYVHDEVGFNFRMTNIEAAVGCAQVENLNKFLESKKRIQLKYNSKLVNEKTGLKTLTADQEQGTYWLSGVLLDYSKHPKMDVVVAKMAEQGITVRPFWVPAHMQKPYESFQRTAMPVCEAIWSRVLTLPCSTQLSDVEQDKVISRLIETVSMK